MSGRTAVSNLLFRLVCALFSALLLLSAILAQVELMTLESHIAELEAEIGKTERELEVLRSRLENRISLKDIETLAINELGMHRPGAEQLYFDMIPG